MGGGAVVEARASDEAGETAPASTYRPHLDGLRAVAVYLVVLFHAGSTQFSGGFIGVDVFFVLSGFLVTQLLLRDVVARSAIRFGRFYSRRFRRLLPAAFVTLIVTAFVYTAIVSPAEVSNAVGSFKAAFLYSTNWYFIHRSQNYFGAQIATNPVLHFWSLAVEEQFYLVWPLALGGLFLATRRLDKPQQMRAIQITVAVGAVASAVWALSLRTSNPNRAYYGTDTRAYELLAGALIALLPALAHSAARFRRVTRVATFASIAVLFVIASSWIHFDAIERGIAVTITTCVLLVAIEAAQGGIVRRALSNSTVVYLGKISYGTYLWHWLVILVVLTKFHVSSIATIGVACLVATALAALSFEILEHPVRTSGLLDRHRATVIAAGLTISLVSALVFIPKIVDPDHASAGTGTAATGATTSLLTPVPKNLDTTDLAATIPYTHCQGLAVTACTVVQGTGRRILLMGDSHAWMLIPTFTEIARRENLSLSVSVWGACPWQRDLYTTYTPALCSQIKQDAYDRLVPALKPDIIVLVNVDYGHPGDYFPFVDQGQRPADFATVAKATTDSVDALRANHKVVLVEPIPIPVTPNPLFDQRACLLRAKYEEECRFQADTAPSPLDLLYERLAKDDTNVDTLSLAKTICPLFPVCDPVVNGEMVRLNTSHIAPKFAATIAPDIDTWLKSVGLLPN